MGAYSSYRFVQRLFLALLLVLAVGQVSGCASVDPDLGRVHLPDAGQLDAPTGGRFVEQTDPRWWRLFGDAILTRIVEDALTANAEVRLALARVKEARADAGYTRADLLPQIGARAQASRDRSSASAPGAFGESSTSTYYQVGFDSSWEVDLFGGRRMAARAAGETVDARIEEADAVRVIVAAEIARVYLELRTLQARQAIAEAALANALALHDLARRRHLLGADHSGEAERVEAAVLQHRALIGALRGEIERTASRLAVAAGRPPGAFDDLAAKPAALPRVSTPPEIAYPAIALRVRPDVRAAERQLAAAISEIGVAEAEFYPKLVLLGSGGILAAGGGDVFSSANQEWSVVPGLSLNLFSGGRLRANVDAAGVRAEQARVAFEQTALDALLEISDGLSLLCSSLARVEDLERAKAASEAAASVFRKRYDLGAENLFAVLDAEGLSLEVADEALLAEAEALMVRIVLYKATAGAPIDAAARDLAAPLEPSS